MSEGPLQGWHVDKRVNIGHMITTLMLALGLTIFLIRLEGRVDINALAISTNASQIERSNRDMKEDIAEIKALLIRIEDRFTEAVRNGEGTR